MLDNKRLRDKMWVKVVESGQIGKGMGSLGADTRSRWETDPRAG